MRISNRVLFVDFAKALAIILMVLLHSNYTYRWFNSSVGSFHMAVFFFVAGLFARGKETSIVEVVKKSFYQLIIPYFGLSVIALLYGWVFPYLHPDLYYTDRSLLDILKKSLIGILLMRDRVVPYAFHPCAALWFLSSLFWCRVLFSLWIHSDKKQLYIVRVLIITALYLCYHYKFSVFAFNSTAVSFPYFILGYYLNYRVVRDYSNFNIIYFIFLFIFAVWAVCMLAGNSVMPDDAEINGILPLAYIRGIAGITSVMAAAIILEKSRWQPIMKILKYVGEATLTILGLHIAFVIIFKVIYVYLGFPKDLIPMRLAMPVSILITLICAYIHHNILMKRIPWLIGKKKK